MVATLADVSRQCQITRGYVVRHGELITRPHSSTPSYSTTNQRPTSHGVLSLTPLAHYASSVLRVAGVWEASEGNVPSGVQAGPHRNFIPAWVRWWLV